MLYSVRSSTPHDNSFEEAASIECESITPSKVSFNVIVSNAPDSYTYKGSTFSNACFSVGTSDAWDTWEEANPLNA